MDSESNWKQEARPPSHAPYVCHAQQATRGQVAGGAPSVPLGPSSGLSEASPCASLPEVFIEASSADDQIQTRDGVLAQKKQFTELRRMSYNEMRGKSASKEKDDLRKAIEACAYEAAKLEDELKYAFLAQHGRKQLFAPSEFFVSPLFRVCSRAATRKLHCEVPLQSKPGRVDIRYQGPELRQSDGRVFLALLHVMRDIRVGVPANFHAEPMCKALFGRYDGNSRAMLREHLRRLTNAVVNAGELRVLLCLSFDDPSTGPWNITLDPGLIRLFEMTRDSWMRMAPRFRLVDGLSTWLLGYVESQTKLIPTHIAKLHKLTGSDASHKAFKNRLRIALGHLAQEKIIETGWSMRNEQVRWLKTRHAPAPLFAQPLASVAT